MSNLIGQTLGPYRIIEQIGLGGMATVYKAYQPSMDRYVAIKVLPALVSRDLAFLKRFRREAKVVAKLEHKHILPVYDYGEQDGLTYLVMRYVEAGTLKDRLVAGQLDLPAIYRIIAQVGAALDYAHRLGVIHRDVKPSNVLVDSQGDAYLTDFGLARIMESSEQLTATGVGVGTPDYMAPEQGQGLKIDHRSDIYSLGVMLYEMATGRVPYEAETPMAVVIKHITAPLPLPSSVKPDIPQQVERVILKAMAKAPDDRFQTVGEMVAALDAAVRLVQAEAPPEVVVGEPSVAKEAAPPTRGFLARAMAGVREATQTGWGRTAMWAAVGIVALLAFFLGLSRVPLKVQIKGGQLEVVRVVEVTITPEAAVPATTPVLSQSPEQSEGAVEGPTEAMAARATATPKSLPTTTPAPTRTPGPTATPQLTATPTPNPMAEQARAFAEPILAAIADRPPDYEDDFSDPFSGWERGVIPSGTSVGGERGYADGEYFLTASPAQYSPDHDFSLTCAWGRPIGLQPFSDMVLEIEGRFLAVGHADLQVNFRQSKGPEGNLKYFVGVGPEGGISIEKMEPESAMPIKLDNMQGPPVQSGLESNHLQIIAVGPQIAVYVNGELALFATDRYFDARYASGTIELTNCNQTDTQMEVRWDNLRIWDVSNLALPSAEATPAPPPTATPTPLPSVAEQARAFAEPILAAIAARPPDFEDDFEDPSSGWRVESGESGEMGYQDGEYLIIANPHPDYPQECCGCYYNSPPSDPWFSDFVLEVDLRIVSGDSEHWDVFFRRTDASTYAAMFSLPRDLALMRMVTEPREDTDLATHHGPPINGGYGTNHLQIIAKGSQMAVYANRESLWLVEDNAAERGQIVLGGCSHSDTPLHIRYDNLKIWDISDLSSP